MLKPDNQQDNQSSRRIPKMKDKPLSLLIEDYNKAPSHTHINYDEFIKKVLEHNPNADAELLKKAFYYSHYAHAGQKRNSGKSFFHHPVNTALILTNLKADSATLAATLLHDCIEDCEISPEDLKEEFGDEIAMLVDGVSKIKDIVFASKEEYKAENIRKVLLATTKDVRVILIKLADRLNNMETLTTSNFKPEKQKRIAEETLEIYAPIAHKLGIRFLKGELEDNAFKILEPEAYESIKEKVAEKREEREQKTNGFISLIKSKLEERGIKAEVVGRAKYFYSIFQKMKKNNKEFNEIYDLIAIRIIVDTVPECYSALGIVHELWRPMPKRFKDYISLPKANGYQSLHTSVLGTHGKIIEIQIRTKEMHHEAEEGIAAHWKYKGTERDKKFDRKISWLKEVLEWKQQSQSAKEFVETLKIDLFQDEIVVFTPKGDPISLPESATTVDFAYAVHSNIGHHCVRAEVNGVGVPLDHPLKSGDVIKIITQPNAKPARGWLSFVKTSKARSKIKAILNIKTDISPDETVGGEKTLINRLAVEGSIKKSSIKFSKCCFPHYGDEIVGFLTKDGKLTIHKKDCSNIYTLMQNKQVNVTWKQEIVSDTKRLRIVVRDRVGLLAEILGILSKSKVNVLSIHTRSKKDKVAITFKINIPKELSYNLLLANLRSVKNVLDIKDCVEHNEEKENEEKESHKLGK